MEIFKVQCLQAVITLFDAQSVYCKRIIFSVYDI